MLQQNILISVLLISVFNSGCKNNPTASVQNPHYKIAFRAFNQIYIMNDDGSDQHKLTEEPAFEQSIRWSPDGSKIGFASDPNRNFEIYVVNIDGSNLKRLTNHPRFNSYSLSWSPDGSKIAYDSDHEGNREIYVMDHLGGSKQRLTNTSGYEDGQPHWSPDGSKIAFIGAESPYFYPPQIFVINPDGTGLKQLTNFEGGVEGTGSWSPDGSRIVFVRFLGGDIYVMSSEGSDLQRLTNIGFRSITGSGFLGWSPDGSKIGFASTHEGNQYIYVMNADGSDLKRLTNLSFGSLTRPSWSPDGSRIAFAAWDEEQNANQIYLLMSDGTGLEQLTSPYRCSAPKWSPVRY